MKWGYKLFVLAVSYSGYTWDFFMYEGKMQGGSGKGLRHDAVMELVSISYLGLDNSVQGPATEMDRGVWNHQGAMRWIPERQTRQDY